MEQAHLAEVARLLRSADSVLFITGAGISADSGLPTYRGVGGLYDRGETEEGMPIEEALSEATLRTRPEVCWKYIAEVEAACRGAQPNDAHHVIREVEERRRVAWVLTQNVDGLHERAGSRCVVAVHGDVHHLHCTGCDWAITVDDYAGMRIPPSCPLCGGLVRPDVVLFGEALPRHAVRALHMELAQDFDVVFSVGTSSLFPYIAEPVVRAHRRGRPVVEINPGTTAVSHLATHRLRAGAAGAFRALRTLL